MVRVECYWSVTRHKVLLLVSGCHSKWLKRVIYFARATRNTAEILQPFGAVSPLKTALSFSTAAAAAADQILAKREKGKNPDVYPR